MPNEPKPPPDFVLQFPVRVGAEPRLVRCRFAHESDVSEIGSWAKTPTATDPPPMRDAAEYGEIAADKWHYLRGVGRVVNSLDHLRAAIAQDPDAEVAMLFAITADWGEAPPVLAFAFFRRTWAHNLCVDFLALNPRLLQAGVPETRGLATGLLYAIMALGEAIHAGRLWGEATDLSVGFYRRQFRVREILDQFSVGRVEQHHFMELARQEWGKVRLPAPVDLATLTS